MWNERRFPLPSQTMEEEEREAWRKSPVESHGESRVAYVGGEVRSWTTLTACLGGLPSACPRGWLAGGRAGGRGWSTHAPLPARLLLLSHRRWTCQSTKRSLDRSIRPSARPSSYLSSPSFGPPCPGFVPFPSPLLSAGLLVLLPPSLSSGLLGSTAAASNAGRQARKDLSAQGIGRAPRAVSAAEEFVAVAIQ